MKKSGFSLMEVLMTLFLLAMLSLVVALTFTSAGTNVHRNRNRIIAYSYAMNALEWLRNYSTADDSLKTSFYQHPELITYYALGATGVGGRYIHHPLIDDFSSSVLALGFSGERIYTVEDINLDGDPYPDLKKVNVTVQWEGD